MSEESEEANEKEISEEDELKNYIKAGKIAKKVVDDSKKLIKPGASLLSIAEEIEAMIKKEGAGCAFPLNISVNENASHYTPSHDDKTVLGDKDVVKVDIGTHVDGFIGDTAYTVDLSGNNGKLVEASEKALENAIAIMKAGVKSNAIGAEIQKTIESYGFKPIRNLSGHGLDQYDAHASFSIPNINQAHGFEIKEDTILALEPFASTGEGYVRESHRRDIYSFRKPAALRNPAAREIMAYAAEEYETLPFAERWLIQSKQWGEFQLKVGLRELLSREVFTSYPILHDVKGSLVSQAEVTLVVEKEGCKILT